MWARGNLHCHTNVSDGDSDPSVVCRFYAEHGYHFLALTEHNSFLSPADVDAHSLLLIPGTELTLAPSEDYTVPIHVNGYGIDRQVRAGSGLTRAETIQNCIDQIVGNGGIAQINHPNFYYAFTDAEIALTQGALLLEIYNGHPLSFNNGDADHIGVERMWDNLLSSGRPFYGTAVDDTHHFQGEFRFERANPMRGWIWARVDSLSVDDVLSALKAGDFYASSGVELEDLVAGASDLRVVVRPKGGLRYHTQFIGDHGRVLQETNSLDSRFAPPQGSEITYLRAKVTAADGTCAWTQPIWVMGVR